jgi:hypothetical protein
MRRTTKTYTLDALYQVTKIQYSDSTPAVTFSFDNSSPAINTDNTIGRWKSVSNANSTTNYLSDDALGGPTATNQLTAGQTYGFAYSYSLAGALAAEMNPMSRVLTTTYDNLNRVATLTGLLSGTTTHAIDELTGITYNDGTPNATFSYSPIGN